MAKKHKKKGDEAIKEIAEVTAEASGEEEPEAADEREALEQERAALDEERQCWQVKVQELKAAALLQERGLPVELAPYFAAADEEQLQEKVDRFEALFREAVARAVVERLRGRETPREPAKARGYSRSELKQLSAKEINSHWEEIVKTLKG